ncbi:hypothetical protein Tco_1081566 [Tanacetum coccineum]|uniref:Uncharacterized protein n=1 Tax=Tanacetum coccineum TaxID=301880 RepID=A0ABQ5HY10_9ASTR
MSSRLFHRFFFRCFITLKFSRNPGDSAIGNGYLRKGQKRSKNDKTEHGMEEHEKDKVKIKVKAKKSTVKVNPET